MQDQQRAEDFTTYSEAIIGFVQWLRLQGMGVGIHESQQALMAAEFGCIKEKALLKNAFRLIFCTSPSDRQQFDSLFEFFWGREKIAVKGKTTYKNQSNIKKKSPASLVWMGMGNGSEDQKEDAKKVSGANQVARLRKTDFTRLTEMESEELEEIAQKLWKQMSLRMKRKMKASANHGRIDLRNTLRRSLNYGGELIELRKKSPKARRKKLVVLLDVSGSMDTYSFFLLRFICALRVHFAKIEAFLFSTHLIRITEYLHTQNLETTLKLMSLRTDNWSSGTRIGESLKQFNDSFAREILHGHSTVIILSDGLDTGEPDLVEEEIKKIKLRTRQLIWLNPLKGTMGYEPIQKGMAAALPQLDHFRSANTLDSILELEKLLINV
ncbi:MAG: VWA domain-containing protein [Bacteroidia bacterium]|nr:VWA domain-containing protein [Bacteroidia bacterium]